jgi:hypothetical protein
MNLLLKVYFVMKPLLQMHVKKGDPPGRPYKLTDTQNIFHSIAITTGKMSKLLLLGIELQFIFLYFVLMLFP